MLLWKKVTSSQRWNSGRHFSHTVLGKNLEIFRMILDWVICQPNQGAAIRGDKSATTRSTAERRVAVG